MTKLSLNKRTVATFGGATQISNEATDAIGGGYMTDACITTPGCYPTPFPQVTSDFLCQDLTLAMTCFPREDRRLPL